MSLPEEFSADLPKPRPDEPAALRQDIADELSDHLRCAALSEQLNNSTGGPVSESAAISAAIERFGEPAVIARRLWWDAMKERIMALRIFTVMATVVAMASLLACGMLYRSLQLSRSQQSALLASQREAMAAMTAELKSSKASDGAQWQTLKIRLVDEQGKPLKGMVHCETKDKSPLSDTKQCGADGLAEFLLPPGQYAVTIECNSYRAWIPALLVSPKPMERKIVCPLADPKNGPVSFKVELTAASGLPAISQSNYFLVGFYWNYRTIGDVTWGRAGSQRFAPNYVCWLIDAQGHVLGQLPKTEAVVDANGNPMTKSRSSQTAETLGPNPVLEPVAGLAAGSYTVTLVPYIASDANEPGAEQDPTIGQGKPSIPTLKRSMYVPGAKSVVIDADQPGGAVIRIDDKFFEKSPSSLPDNLFAPG